MSHQELHNKFIIFDLVKKYFGYTSESLKLFKYRLFQNPHIAPEYAKLLKGAKDLRVRFPIDNYGLMKDMDDGWKTFTYIFTEFVSHTRLSYGDFLNNKVILPGETQELKLKKALEKFYLSIYPELMLTDDSYFAIGIPRLVDNMAFLKIRFGKILLEDFYGKPSEKFTVKEFHFITSSELQEARLNEEESELCGYRTYVNERPHEATFTLSNFYKILIKKKIQEKMEEVGKKRLPTKNKLQLVLSLNFADWFLCSTGEKWTSCINLDSEYEGAFWASIPGTIGDKNRAFCYITDGKKKNYHGIIVDRVITRSWVSLVRTGKGKNSETKFHFAGEYPGETGLEDIAERVFEIDVIKRPEKFISKYYFEFLYQLNGYSHESTSCLYNDTLKPCIAKKNKAKYFLGKYGYYKYLDGAGALRFRRTKNGMLKSNDDDYFYLDGGLQYLINNGRSVSECFDADGDYVEEEEEEYVYEG